MAKLSEGLCKVLSASDTDANASIETIAKRTGLRSHQVRYSLERLQQLGVVKGSYPIIDTFRIGLSNIAILFSLAAKNSKDRETSIEAALKFKNIAWLSDLVGQYEFGALLIAPKVEVVSEFWQVLRRTKDLSIVKRSINIRNGFWVWPRRYLAPRVKHPAPIEVRALNPNEEAQLLDELDSRILSALTNSSSTDYAKLAKEEKIPPPTLYRRISSLEERKILRNRIYNLNLESLQVKRYRLLLRCNDASPSVLESLLAFAEREVNVTNLVECIGEWDYELAVEFRELYELRDFINRLHDSFGARLLDIQSLAVNQYRKFQMYSVGK